MFYILFLFLLILLALLIAKTPILAMIGRELRYWIGSHIGFWMLLGQALLSGFLYQAALGRFEQMPLVSPYTSAPLLAFFHGPSIAMVQWIIIPALTMRLIAEERSLGTWELLVTYPLDEWHIVVGKFLAAWVYYLILWLPSLGYIFCISLLGNIDIHQIITTYFYLAWTGAALIAIGLLASSFTTSQLVAWITALIALFPMFGFTLLNQKFIWLKPWMLLSLEQALRGTITSFTFILFFILTLCAIIVTILVVRGHRHFIGCSLAQHRAELSVIGCLILLISGIAFLWHFSWSWRMMMILGVLGSSYFLTIRMSWMLLRYCLSIFLLVSLTVEIGIVGYQTNVSSDMSQNQSFSLHPQAQKMLNEALAPRGHIHAIAFVTYHEQHQHEHTERDNERFFILQECLRKFAESLNHAGEIHFTYEFFSPVQSDQSVESYLQQNQSTQERLSQLQNQYGVMGYRELILISQGQAYILQDPQLFIRKLLPEQVPQLCLLWRRIYESGGIAEPPPQEPEQALAKLQQIGNPEMFAIFPHPHLESNIVQGILQLVHNQLPCIYFTQGHGELAIQGQMSQDYQTAHRLADDLRRFNFKLRPLLWHQTKQIPDDCDVLVVLGSDARFPLGSEQLAMVQNYLDQGGKLLLCLPPGSDSGWQQILVQYRLRQYPGMLAQHYWGQNRKPQKTNSFELELPSSLLTTIHEDAMNDKDSSPTIFVSQVSPISFDPQLPQHRYQALVGGLFSMPPTVGIDMITEDLDTKTSYYLGWMIQGIHNEYIIVLGTSSFISDAPFYTGEETSLPYILVANNRQVFPEILKIFSFSSPSDFAVPPQISITFIPPKNFNSAWYLYGYWILSLIWGMLGGIGWYLYQK